MTDIAVDPVVLDADLAESWDAVIDWLRSLDDEVFDAETPLPGWRVRDLVTHLGLSMRVLANAEPADPADGTTQRHDLCSYLAAYSADADGIREAARTGEDDTADPVTLAEERGAAALATLARLRREGVTRVLTRRGVIDLTTLVLTRLVEVVVHGDDLARSAHVPTPVDPTARTTVAQAFLSMVNRRSGYDLEVGDERAWIRLAAGRIGWDQRGGALRSGNLAEGLPDLREWLPVVG